MLEQVGKSADMVHVTVGQHDPAQQLLVFNDVIKIGQHQIDAVQVVFGEHDPAIDNDHVAAVLQQGHVLADFAQAADRNDLQTFTHNSL